MSNKEVHSVTSERLWLMRARSIGAVLTIVSTVILAACEPKNEMTLEAQRKAQCLDKPCPGDQRPRFDQATEAVFKRGGRWFVGPKVYGFTLTGHGAFFWPSKTPSRSPTERAPEFVALGVNGVSNFYDVAIEFFVSASNSKGETYEFITNAEKRGEVLRRVQVSRSLQIVDIKDASEIDKVSTYYVASELQTPSGVPATAGCRHNHPDSECTSGFVWKPGMRVSVRFNHRHAKDWPEVCREVLRVLDQIRESP